MTISFHAEGTVRRKNPEYYVFSKKRRPLLFLTRVSLYFIKAEIASKPIAHQQTPAFLLLGNPARCRRQNLLLPKVPWQHLPHQ